MKKKSAKKKPVRNTQIVPLSLHNDLVEKLHARSLTQNVSRSAIVSIALSEYFSRTAPPIQSTKIT